MGLTRKQEALLRSLYTRHGRKKTGMCVCEGVRCCGELYANVPDLVVFSVATPHGASSIDIPGECIVVSEEEFSHLSATVNAQGVLAVARQKPELPEDTPVRDQFVLALDKVGDPGNFGTILRTAKAAGLHELWYTRGAVDPFHDKVIRSALGAQFLLDLRCFDSLATLAQTARRQSFGQIYLTDPHRGENCFTALGLFDRSIVVIGSEGDGVSDLDGGIRVTIPMPGRFESLNAAQAATIFLFEYVRRITS